MSIVDSDSARPDSATDAGLEHNVSGNGKSEVVRAAPTSVDVGRTKIASAASAIVSTIELPKTPEIYTPLAKNHRDESAYKHKDGTLTDGGKEVRESFNRRGWRTDRTYSNDVHQAAMRNQQSLVPGAAQIEVINRRIEANRRAPKAQISLIEVGNGDAVAVEERPEEIAA